MGLIGIAIIAVVAIGIYVYSTSSSKSPSPAMTAAPSPSAAAVSPTVAMMAKATFKDGTYTQEGTYVSPGGEEKIGVKITIKNGLVTESEVTPESERPMSLKFQKQFAEGYKEFVIGKNINEIKLDKVAGSSLSPKGFNDAVEKIKAEAKA